MMLQVADRAWMLFVFAVIYRFAHGVLFTVMPPIAAGLLWIACSRPIRETLNP